MNKGKLSYHCIYPIALSILSHSQSPWELSYSQYVTCLFVFTKKNIYIYIYIYMAYLLLD